MKRYSDSAFNEISGWLMLEALQLLETAANAQDLMGVEGGVAEIGVFHGKVFVAMNGLVRDPATRSVAIDLFGDQQLNIDSSGQGDEQVFRANLERYDRHRGKNVVLLRADSTALTPEDVLSRLNVRPRIFSIDGGHTPEHTIADIELASRIIAASGIVIVDDVLNHHWPGVIEGVVLYLHQRRTLWPVAIGYNKLLLCPMSLHRTYRAHLSKLMDFTKSVSFCGYEVLAT